MPQGLGSLWIPRPSRGKIQSPTTLNIEAGRGNGYAYNGSGYTLTMTNQSQYYTYTLDTQVPASNEEQVSPTTGALPSNAYTILQAGWWLLHYTMPCTGMDASQTYQSAVHVNGVAVDSGVDTISGVTSYTFGGNGTGVATAGLNSTGYYRFAVNDVVDVRVRCTTAASKTLTIAANATAFNPMSYTYQLSPYTVQLQQYNVQPNLTAGQIVVSQSDLYTLTRATSTNSWAYIRVTRGLNRYLYSPSPMSVWLEANDILDVCSFKQNPSGSTAAPWTPNGAMNFDVTTTRSSGL